MIIGGLAALCALIFAILAFVGACGVISDALDTRPTDYYDE